MEKKQTAQQRYDARTARHIHLKLNKGTDADIIAKLETVNIQGYIKELIRRDIQK